MKDLTLDSISMRGAGVVTIAQPKKGARFTQDSVLLADFCRVRKHDRILEPGAGSGVVSLLLAKKFPSSKIAAAELQPLFAELCRKNVLQNRLRSRVTVIERNINSLKGQFPPGSFDVIIANPPYAKNGAGRQSPILSRRIARHGGPCSVEAWIDLHILLKNKGRFFIVYAASGTADLISSFRGRKMEPKRVRFVHSFRNRPAWLVLIEAVKSAGRGLEVLPPLIVHAAGNEYTREVKEIYGLAD